MKLKYPIEAFALAIIVFSQNMQSAILTGIIVLFLTTLGLFLNTSIKKLLPIWSRRISIGIFIMAVTYAMFHLVMVGLFGIAQDNSIVFLQLIIGALVIKYIIQAEEEEDFGQLLYQGSFAFGFLLLTGIIREFMFSGKIFGSTIIEFDLMSRGFQSHVVGFLLAGIGIAILNRLFGNQTQKSDSFYVIIPMILVYRPYQIDSIKNSFGILLAILITVLLVLSVRMYIKFSRTSKEWRNLPIELVSASIIYLVLAAF